MHFLAASTLNLIDALKQIQDYRTQSQYPLGVIPLLVLIATLSGWVGYRAIEAFVVRHSAQWLSNRTLA